jgi:hypothetical protein
VDTETIMAEREREKERLSKAIDAFAEEMKARANQKVDEGYVGWDSDAGWQPWTPTARLYFEADAIEHKFHHPTARLRKLIDAANFACFAWALTQWVPSNPRGEAGS